MNAKKEPQTTPFNNSIFDENLFQDAVDELDLQQSLKNVETERQIRNLDSTITTLKREINILENRKKQLEVSLNNI